MMVSAAAARSRQEDKERVRNEVLHEETRRMSGRQASLSEWLAELLSVLCWPGGPKVESVSRVPKKQTNNKPDS